jgi:glyoxylase-like metal-dependent hydrolase (beta-lactamase superfamily II)
VRRVLVALAALTCAAAVAGCDEDDGGRSSYRVPSTAEAAREAPVPGDLGRDGFDPQRIYEAIAPGVVTVELPGHLPGHLGLRLGDDAFLIADVAVHPVLLDQPDWIYVSDEDSETSVGTRRSLVPTVVDQDVLVVCGHYPDGGIGRVRRREDRAVWEPYNV